MYMEFINNVKNFIKNADSMHFGECSVLGTYTVAGRQMEINPNIREHFQMPTEYPLNLRGIKIKKDCSENDILSDMIRFLQEANVSLGVNKIIAPASALAKIMIISNISFITADNCKLEFTKCNGNLFLIKKDSEELLTYTNMYETNLVEVLKKFCITENRDANSGPVHSSLYNCVFQRNIGDLSLVYVSAINCVMSDDPVIKDIRRSKIVELKIAKRPIDYNNKYHRMRLMRWWTQCCLKTAPYIMVANVDENLLVSKPFEKISTSDLPMLTRNEGDPQKYLFFLYKFLKKVMELMVDVDCPYTIYEFHFDARKGNICYQIKNMEPPLSVLLASFNNNNK